MKLYFDINLLCIIIIIMLFIKTLNFVEKSSKRRMYLHLLIASICFLCFDSLREMFRSDYIHVSLQLKLLISSGYFVFLAFLPCFWFLYSENIQQSKISQNEKVKFVFMIPMLIMILLSAVRAICSVLFAHSLLDLFMIKFILERIIHAIWIITDLLCNTISNDLRNVGIIVICREPVSAG